MSVPPYQTTSYQPGQYAPPPPPKKSALPWILGLGCGVPTVLIVGCVAFGAQAVKNLANDPEFQKEMKTLRTNTVKDKVAYDPTKFELTPSESGYNITGTIKNTSAEVIPAVIVKFDVMDKNGEVIESCMESTSRLAPKAEWNFKAPVTSKNPAKFKLVLITNAPFDLIPKK